MSHPHAPGATEPLLAVDRVSCVYDGFKAVDTVSFTLQPREMLGIAGTNGAGKSTLFAAIAGQQTASAGTIAFAGQLISRLEPYQRARLGLVRTFQVPREFKSLTVRENLLASAPNFEGEQLFAALMNTRARQAREQDLNAKADEILTFLNLTKVCDVPARNLSGGQKKLVELGRVLMLEPRCILLDEPFAGVNPVLVEQLSEHIVALNQKGIAFVVIEHHLQALKALTKRLIVMDRGLILAQGDSQTVLDDPRVQVAYMGGVT
ncbi:MAG: ABC transporter ATP-binding protein [Alcaligenaceae bacterium]|nr:MAG: ABC transporter ATP-binding protein [Alcaligenaceae bacterium]